MTNLPITVAAEAFRFLADVRDEYRRAVKKHGLFSSAHEGWAVMFEEVDELWDEVRKRRKNRDPEAMRTECVQIAAMALNFAISCCREAGKESK